MTAAILKPLYTVVNRTLKNMDTTDYAGARNNVITATEEIVAVRDSLLSPCPSAPVYRGPTDGTIQLDPPEAPYLPR